LKESVIKMRKKIISVILAISLCFTLLATCASAAGISSTASTAKTTTTAPQGGPQGAPPNGTPPDGTPPSGGPGGSAPGGNGAPGGSSGKTVTGTAIYSVSGKTAAKSGGTYTAAKVNQSGVIVNSGGKLTLKNATVKKTGGNTSSEDQSNFYGLNAGLLADGKSTLTVSGSKITTNADGSNGVFATNNSIINISNSTISTTKNSSRGLDATLKGTVNASNVTINTLGIHCAAIATDRGNGTINVTGGKMTTAGKDSPGIYCTGKITVTGATIRATGSEAAVVEGRNSITLSNVNITGEKTNGVMLYQSYSGDAEVGTASFKMTGGSLTSKAGALFFITNTDSAASLKNVVVKNSTGVLISACATSRWGTSGSNGGKLKFTADTETLSGKVLCDKISSVTMSLKNKTNFTGSINTENKLANVSVSLDSTSRWIVNANSYVKALTDSDHTLANIQSNGHTIYYDSTNSANSWLGGKTVKLAGGGTLTPVR
jgi:hypothetical protein